MPDLSATRGVRSRKIPDASISAPAASGKERRTGKDVPGADAFISACNRSSGGSGSRRPSNRHQSGVNCRGGGAEEKVQRGGDVWTNGSIGIPMANGRTTTNGADDSWPLPDNWSAFIAPEEREYFFDARRNVVQWERPTG